MIVREERAAGGSFSYHKFIGHTQTSEFCEDACSEMIKKNKKQKKNNNPAALLNQTGLNIQAEEVPSFASYYNHAL